MILFLQILKFLWTLEGNIYVKLVVSIVIGGAMVDQATGIA